MLVVPDEAEVAIVDATWQDYPEWEEDADAQWVASRAFSLIDADNPPYPGIAVRTRPGTGSEEPQEVQVEIWQDEVPSGVHRVHSTLLNLGLHGVELGDVRWGHSEKVGLEAGKYELEVWVDGEAPHLVSRVVFVLGAFTPFDRSEVNAAIAAKTEREARHAGRPSR
jgi:hypothetical protein